MKLSQITNALVILSIGVIILHPIVGNAIYFAILLFMSFFSIVNLIRKNNLKINTYEIIFGILIGLCFFSKAYALYQPTTNYIVKELFFCFGISFCILNYLNSDTNHEARCYKLLDYFLLFTVILCIYLLIFELPKVINTRDRLGRTLFENYGTYITYSYYLIISLSYLIWKFVYKKAKKIDYAFFLILLITAVLSGTRKSLFCPVIFAVFVLLFKYHANFFKLLKIAVIGLLCFFAFYFVSLNNEILYKFIGRRLESLVSIVLKDDNQATVDASLAERKQLQKLAMNAFKEKPLLGWGANNFSVYSEMNSGPFLYAHNNYLELLSTLGIIGFSLYYGGYFCILYSAYKEMKRSNYQNIFLIFAISFLLMNLISDIQTVSYSRLPYILIFMLFARYLCFERKRDVKHEI